MHTPPSPNSPNPPHPLSLSLCLNLSRCVHPSHPTPQPVSTPPPPPPPRPLLRDRLPPSPSPPPSSFSPEDKEGGNSRRGGCAGMPCLGSPDTAALEVLMRTAGEEAAAAGGSYTSLASLQHLTAPAGMGLVFDAAHEQGTDLAALENLEQILGTIDEAPSSRASSRPDSRSVRPTPPPQAAAAAAAARAGSRQQLLPSSRGSVGGGGGVLPPLRGASGVGGRPPPQRRVSELYSPLDRLLGKKMAAVAAGGGGEVAAAAEACDLGSLDGRRRFVCSMRRWAECEGREVSPAAAGLTAAAHPPALPVVPLGGVVYVWGTWAREKGRGGGGGESSVLSFFLPVCIVVSGCVFCELCASHTARMRTVCLPCVGSRRSASSRRRCRRYRRSRASCGVRLRRFRTAATRG